MNRIIRIDGTELCLVDKARYIKRSDYGVFVEAERKDAIGVAVKGVVYNLLGHDEIAGADTVLVSDASTADELTAQRADLDEQKNVAAITFVSLAEKGDIDEVTATEHADLFEAWVTDKDYAVGKILTRPNGKILTRPNGKILTRPNGNLYKCVQAHRSQAGWEPENTPALWTKIGDPTEEYPEWSQPLGAHDAYPLGAKVSHNGKKWTSDVANNVWEPGVYGWSEVTAEIEGVRTDGD